MKPQVIGLTGYKRSGKDTVAKLLGVYGYKPYALAGPVKKTARAIDPYVLVTREEAIRLNLPADGFFRFSEVVGAIGEESAKDVADVRQLLQRVGTEGGRSVHGEDVWLNLAARTIFAEADHRAWVISDVRFGNEADWVRSVLGGQVWKVERPGVGGADGHPSETGVDEIKPDRYVDNSGTLKQLSQTVDDILFPRQFTEMALD